VADVLGMFDKSFLTDFTSETLLLMNGFEVTLIIDHQTERLHAHVTLKLLYLLMDDFVMLLVVVIYFK